MGTNYYIVEPLTINNKHQERWYERQNMHVGKSSMGWTFTFHANGQLKTWREHLEFYKYLDSVGWVIINEYGYELKLDDFVALVETKRNEPHSQAREYPRDDITWLDEEGNSFTDGEFS